ncbi:FHA domain-containing protein [Pirellulaceae bacterium]|nr:FHA domain-containing protein [Pirellulaceae bacterium]
MKTISVGLPVVIGRGTDSSLTIKHPLLSRRHCEVYEEGGQVLVRDLASLNGTFVNDIRVETALPLVSGAQLKLGSVEMQVVFEGGTSAEASEADFEMGAVAAAQTEPMPIVGEGPPAEVEEDSFDLADFEVNETSPGEESAGDDAGFDLADFEVTDSAAEQVPEVDDAIAETGSLDLGDFAVSTPEATPADDMLDLGDFEVAVPAAGEDAPEAQVELPSLMDLAGGLEEEVAEVAPADAAPEAEPPATDDPWAPPTKPKINPDDDDLDAFLADLS